MQRGFEPDAPPQSGGLSGGIIALIIIIVLLVLIGLCFLAVKLRKKSTSYEKHGVDETGSTPMDETGPEDMDFESDSD